MDVKTGRIYDGTPEYIEKIEHELGRKLLPLTPSEAERLKQLKPKERIKWAEHHVSFTSDERSRRKEARKRARKARRAQRGK